MKQFFNRFWPVVGILILVLLVVVIKNLSNPAFKVVRDDTFSILLTSSNDPKQLIYEDKNVKIIIGYDQFMKFGSTDEKEEFARVFRGQTNSSLYIDNPYLAANALESGNAVVMDKRYNRQVTRVNIRYYEYWCGILCGHGTRTFYFPDCSIFRLRGRKFLEVLDWIS